MNYGVGLDQIQVFKRQRFGVAGVSVAFLRICIYVSGYICWYICIRICSVEFFGFLRYYVFDAVVIGEAGVLVVGFEGFVGVVGFLRIFVFFVVRRRVGVAAFGVSVSGQRVVRFFFFYVYGFRFAFFYIYEQGFRFIQGRLVWSWGK